MSAVSTVAPHQMRKPGRRVAIGADVVGRVLLLRAAWRSPSAAPCWPRRRSGRRTAGRPTCSSGSPDRSRDARSSRRDCTQRSSAAALASARAISASRPPIRSAQSSANSQSSTHSIEGVLIVSPLKMPSISLPPLVRRKIFGSGRGAGSRSSRSTARGLKHQHAVRRLAAERLLPAEGADIDLRPVDVLREGRRGRVADGEAGAVGGDPVGVGHAHAAGRAVPGEDDVARRIDPAEVADLAIIGGADFGIELQLLGDVGHPAGAEALPRQHGHRPRAEQRPDRHLHRAGVGGGDDAEPVVGGQAAAARGCARSLRRSLALPIAPRCERPSAAVSSDCGRPARRLGAGTGREIRALGRVAGFAGARRAGGSSVSQCHSPRRELAPRWDGVARSRL